MRSTSAPHFDKPPPTKRSIRLEDPSEERSCPANAPLSPDMRATRVVGGYYDLPLDRPKGRTIRPFKYRN